MTLGYVENQWVAHALPTALADAWHQPADGVMTAETEVEPLRPLGRLRDALLVAGCDPALGVLAAHYGERFGPQHLTAIGACSGRALRLLAQNTVHIAGSHLRDEATGAINVPFVQRALPQRSMLLFQMAKWQMGFVVRRGNPKGIRAAEDLARADVRVVNREADSGARRLLDRLLQKAGVAGVDVAGYGHQAPGHLAVAQVVTQGLADVGIALLGAAQAFDLDFVPLEDARFDLVVPRQLQSDPRVGRLLDVLGSHGFRRELAVLGGYDTSESGQLMAEIAAG